MKYEKQYPHYKTQSHGIKNMRPGGFNHVNIFPEIEIMWIVAHYRDSRTQLRVLETIRWLPYNIQNRIKSHLKYACDITGANPEAVIIIVNKCTKFNSNRTITRKEIREITGYPAMPIMKAVSIIMEFPYSLRGLTPDRRTQNNFGLRGKPIYKR